MIRKYSSKDKIISIELGTKDKKVQAANQTESERQEGHRAQDHKDDEPPPAPERLKSKGKMIFIGLIISISAINLGYSLKQITSVPIQTIVAEYNVTIDSFAALSVLIGIMPVGAVFGVLITVKMIRCNCRRVLGVYIFTAVNCLAAVFININQFPSLIVGRFVEGICIGFYAGIAPIYLREIAPKEMRRMLGLFFSLGKIIGVIFVIVMETIFRKANVTIGYRFILSGTAFFAVIQVFLIFFFGSNTPTQMMEKGEQEEAREILRGFYKEEYVEQLFKEYTEELKAAKGQSNQEKEPEQVRDQKYRTEQKSKQNLMDVVVAVTPDQSTPEVKQNQTKTQKKAQAIELQSDMVSQSDRRQELTFQQKKSMLFCLGTHMCALRQYCGGNVLLIQGGLFVKTFNPGLGEWTSLIINMVQFAAILVGIIYLQTIIGKKPTFIFSLAAMSVLNFALVVAMIYQEIEATMFLMCLFMIVFGGAFINQNWAYPSEVIPANESTIPNIVHWLTLSTANLVPPLVSGVMPKNNPFPVFIFFGIYCFIGFIHVRKSLQETDGFTYMEIVRSMK